jgi:hypothetical protein
MNPDPNPQAEPRKQPVPDNPSYRRWIALMLALLASGSTWFYINRILRAQQLADAAAKHRPRGNLSDLYPRWLGARELLLHGRNPYSAEITREIQQGYYGRPLDPSLPDDPKDREGFAYPAYVVFLLAPTIGLPFDSVMIGFRWLLIALAAASVGLWLRVLRWKPSCVTVAILAVLAVGWLPMVQGIKLQQLSLLVAGLLAACGACLAAGQLFLAGIFLAFATIKPQLAWPLVLWLVAWAASDWRARRWLVIGFGTVMALLLGGAEFVLPGWLHMFVAGLSQYHVYTQNQSVLVWLFGSVFGRIFEVLSVLACGACIWSVRRESASTRVFGRAFALVLALTVLIVPMFAPYNQVLLVPAILVLLRSAISGEQVLPTVRVARMIGGILVIWPWVATLALSAAYPWITPAVRERAWPMPFYSNFLIPVFIFGLALLDIWLAPPSIPILPDAAAAE